jgi:hypothetical protein
LRAVENDFDGTRMTIPRTRDATGQGGDGGAFVRSVSGRAGRWTRRARGVREVVEAAVLAGGGE